MRQVQPTGPAWRGASRLLAGNRFSRQFLIQPRPASTADQFCIDLVQMRVFGGDKNEQVVEHISAFGEEVLFVFAERGDDGFDGLLAQLLADPGRTARQELRGVGLSRAGSLAIFDLGEQRVERMDGRGRQVSRASETTSACR